MADTSDRVEALFSQLGEQGEQAGPVWELIQFITTQAEARNARLEAEIASLRVQQATYAKPPLATTAPASTSYPPTAPRVEVPVPSNFEGKSEEVEPFLARVKDYMTLKEADFPTERYKIQWCLYLFSGPRAEPWARSKRDALADSAVKDPYTKYGDLERDV